MDKKDKCNIEFKSSKDGNDVEIKMSGNCAKQMKIIENLPERRREYYKRRLDQSSESSSIESS